MKRWICLATLLFGVLGGGAARAEKRALLVGVTQLQNIPQNYWLHGPANDVAALRDLLIERYGFAPQNITLLTGADATRANIQAAFKHTLIAPSTPDGLALFFFSGHGTQVKDENGDEADGLDEALVPYDARNAASSLLVDDDLGAWLARVRARQTVVILDACHSGTGTRGVARAKSLAPEILGLPPVAAPAGSAVPGTRGADATPSTPLLEDRAAQSNLTVLSAAAPDETAAEYPFLAAQPSDASTPDADQSAHDTMGALTYYLLQAMHADDRRELTYGAARELIYAKLQQGGFTQTPQLEGKPQTRILAGGDELTAPPKIVPDDRPAPPPENGVLGALAAAQVTRVQTQNDVTRVELRALPGARLVAGSYFQNAPDKDLRVTNDSPTQRALVKLESADGATGRGRVLRGEIQAGARLMETVRALAPPRLRLAVSGALAAPASARLAALEYVEIAAPSTRCDADLEIEKLPDGLRFSLFRNQQLITSLVAADLAAAWTPLTRTLENLFWIGQLSQLENPAASFGAQLRVNGKAFDQARIGDTVSFSARVGRDAYAYLFDVDAAGQITLLFPNRFVPGNLLRAGQEYALPAPQLYRLRVAGPAGNEVLKLIVSSRPLHLESFPTGSALQPLAGEAATLARTLLDQLRREINAGSLAARAIVIEDASTPASASGAPLALDGWSSAEVLLRVREK
jgi:hypothetical protein